MCQCDSSVCAKTIDRFVYKFKQRPSPLHVTNCAQPWHSDGLYELNGNGSVAEHRSHNAPAGLVDRMQVENEIG
jgi:hypothetical protein